MNRAWVFAWILMLASALWPVSIPNEPGVKDAPKVVEQLPFTVVNPKHMGWSETAAVKLYWYVVGWEGIELDDVHPIKFQPKVTLVLGAATDSIACTSTVSCETIMLTKWDAQKWTIGVAQVAATQLLSENQIAGAASRAWGMYQATTSVQDLHKKKGK